jgi:S-formylglutathione hydrolase FrmB
VGISLLHGWFPVALAVATIAALLAAIGWRDTRWRLRLLPVAVAVGVLVAVLAGTHSVQLTGDADPMPPALWIWLGVCATALTVLAVGWRSARWWRRGTALLAAALAALACANTVNRLVDYYPTLGDAFGDWQGQPVPGQLSLGQARGSVEHLTTGRLVAVTIPATYSHFRHRRELVYLPPAWFASAHRPALPVVEMITSDHGSPPNWVRIGHAVRTTDRYAAAHHGWAPILVFADPAGDFFTDTECVDGPRGDSETHLVRDIPPYIERTFGASTNPAHWGVAGFSMGGTCAIDLVVEHPSVFRHFVDISGDQGPNAGDKQQTIAHLYGGVLAAWQAHDPLTVLGRRHGYPPGTSGWFEAGNRERLHVEQALRLARAARADGVTTTVVVRDGGHVWPFATEAFADALPWLAEQVGVPDSGAATFTDPGAAPHHGHSR